MAKDMIINRYLQRYPLPGVITAKIGREPKYDPNGYSLVYFGGYDILDSRNRTWRKTISV